MGVHLPMDNLPGAFMVAAALVAELLLKNLSWRGGWISFFALSWQLVKDNE